MTRSARSATIALAAAALVCGCSSGDEHAGTASTPGPAGQDAQAPAGDAGASTPAGGDGGGSASDSSGGPPPVPGMDASTPAEGGGAPDAGAQADAATRGTPTLFWLDVSGKMLTSDATMFAAKTLVASAGQGPDGIAVDLAGGHIYWTNMGVPANNDGSLTRSNLDGSNVTVIVPMGGTWTPKQLKLEPTEQKLYWSDREGMRVMRANLDGSGIETLYTSGTTDADRQDASRWCVGIAVDVAGGYFYWSQKGDDTAHAGSLRRAHLAMPAGQNDMNRTDVEILYDGLAAPVDIDLDLGAGLIYWDNRGDNTVNRGPIQIPSGATASTRTDRQIIVPNVNQAIGIALDHERGLVYYTDAVGDVGRSNLDGSSSKFLLTKSGAFTGIVIVDLAK
jgi:DNA-binding beta-propeller fold protein YncE